MARSIKFTKTYHHPVEKVWQALTDKNAMSEWLMPCDIEAVVGNKFQFRTKPYPGFDGIVNCEVVKVEKNKELSFTWSGGSLENTLVTFKLEADSDMTILHFEHSGFEGLVNKIIVKKILANGWKKKILLIQLPKFLDNE